MIKRPSFDEYYINIADAVLTRATCIRRKYGAIIVKDNVIISTGYCGSPRGSINCSDIGVCKREELNIPSGERYELCNSVHSESNAIMNADPFKKKGATMYIAGRDAKTNEMCDAIPCMMCERLIKNSMIEKVIVRLKDGSIKQL